MQAALKWKMKKLRACIVKLQTIPCYTHTYIHINMYIPYIVCNFKLLDILKQRAMSAFLKVPCRWLIEAATTVAKARRQPRQAVIHSYGPNRKNYVTSIGMYACYESLQKSQPAHQQLV